MKKDLLKTNAYQILGLNVTASTKEITKRSKEIIRILQIDNIPNYNSDLNKFIIKRTETYVNQAYQKLNLPQKKFKEFFFWIQNITEIDEKALSLIQNEKYLESINLWNTPDKTNGHYFGYQKNLAILYCLLLTTVDNDSYLKKSLFIWKKLIESESFWKYFIKIFNLYGEQTISQDAYTSFKNNIALNHISNIYTELFQIHENKNFIFQFQKTFNFKGENLKEYVLNPLYSDINKNLDFFKEIKINEKEKISTTKIKKNLKNIQNKISDLKKLGFQKDSQTIVLKEKIIKTLNKVAININNKLEDYDTSLLLLEAAHKLCETSFLKNKIEKNLSTINENLKFRKETSPDYCWFCGEKIKNTSFSIKEPLYKIINSFYTLTNRNIQYKTISLTIPRCQNCSIKHNNIFITCNSFACILILIISLSSLTTGILLALPILFISNLIAKCWEPKNTKNYSHKKNYPLYKELLKDGWIHGKGPS